MEKRNFYILIGAGVILGILILLTFVLGSPKPQPQPDIQTRTGQTSLETGPYEQLPPPSRELSPEDIAKGFYDWYVSHPDPLGSGDYQNNPYLTDDYKETMTGFVVRGDHLNSEPVLPCVGINPPENIAAQPAAYSGSEVASVILQIDAPGAKPLYKVILKNVDQRWLVEDIRCIL